MKVSGVVKIPFFAEWDDKREPEFNTEVICLRIGCSDVVGTNTSGVLKPPGFLQRNNKQILPNILSLQGLFIRCQVNRTSDGSDAVCGTIEFKMNLFACSLFSTLNCSNTACFGCVVLVLGTVIMKLLTTHWRI